MAVGWPTEIAKRDLHAAFKRFERHGAVEQASTISFVGFCKCVHRLLGETVTPKRKGKRVGAPVRLQVFVLPSASIIEHMLCL